MSGGGEEVRKRAISREQRVRTVDWMVATRIAGAMSETRTLSLEAAGEKQCWPSSGEW